MTFRGYPLPYTLIGNPSQIARAGHVMWGDEKDRTDCIAVLPPQRGEGDQDTRLMGCHLLRASMHFDASPDPFHSGASCSGRCVPSKCAMGIASAMSRQDFYAESSPRRKTKNGNSNPSFSIASQGISDFRMRPDAGMRAALCILAHCATPWILRTRNVGGFIGPTTGKFITGRPVSCTDRAHLGRRPRTPKCGRSRSPRSARQG